MAKAILAMFSDVASGRQGRQGGLPSDSHRAVLKKDKGREATSSTALQCLAMREYLLFYHQAWQGATRMSRFGDGAFTFYVVKPSLEPMFPEQIAAIAHRHGIPDTITPAYAGDRATVSKALGKGAPKGWLLRKIVADQTQVIYGIVSETRDQEAQTLEFTHESSCTWSMDEDAGSAIHGDHEVAQLVNDAYQELRGKIIAGDWTGSLIAYLTDDCIGMPLRSDGRVFWVPPHGLDSLRKLTVFLDEIGISVIMCEIEPLNKVVIHEAVSASIESRLKELQDEVEQFDGTQRPSTYKDRMAQYVALKKRARTYRDVLGISIADAEAALEVLETKVGAMLLDRNAKVIHRNGTQTGVESDLVAPRNEETTDLVQSDDVAF